MKLFAPIWSLLFLAATVHLPVLANEQKLRLEGRFHAFETVSQPAVKRAVPSSNIKYVQHPAFNPAVHETTMIKGREHFPIVSVTRFTNGTAVRHNSPAEARKWIEVTPDADPSLYTFLAETKVGMAIGYSIAGLIGAIAIGTIIYSIGAAIGAGKGNTQVTGGQVQVGDGGLTVGSGSHRRDVGPPEEHLNGVPDGQCAMQSSIQDGDDQSQDADLTEDVANSLGNAVHDDINNNNLADAAYRLNDNGNAGADLVWSCSSTLGGESDQNGGEDLSGRSVASPRSSGLKLKEKGDGYAIYTGPVGARVPGRLDASRRYDLGSPQCGSIYNSAPVAGACPKLAALFQSKGGQSINVDDGQCEYFAGTDDSGVEDCWFNACNVSGCGSVTSSYGTLSDVFGGIVATCVQNSDQEGWLDQTNPSVEYQVTGKSIEGMGATVHVGKTGCS